MGAMVYTTKGGRGAPQQGFGVTATFGATAETPLRLPNYQNRYGQGFGGQFDFVDGNGGGGEELPPPRRGGQPRGRPTRGGWERKPPEPPHKPKTYFRLFF